MHHWIGVYFSVPDSELTKICKAAGLLWQWIETVTHLFSLSVSCLLPVFSLSCLGFYGYRWHIGGFIWDVFI